MELAKCEIRLAGSLVNTVVRNDITPAEMLILRELHGDECIANIEFQEKKSVSHEDLITKLQTFYNTENGRRAFERVFPGSQYTLPQTFREIGYDVSEEGELRRIDELQRRYQEELKTKVAENADRLKARAAEAAKQEAAKQAAQ